MSKAANTILAGLRLQGQRADALFAKAGIVVTQGGEPTFIPASPVQPEWNLEALGEEKLALAWKLCRALEENLLPGAVILRSNGKHYPGEPIPRWKLTLLRCKEAPLWRNTKLLTQGKPSVGQGKTGSKPPVTPRKFLATLAVELGIPGSLSPVYEDVEAAMRAAAARGEQQPLPRYSRTKKGFLQPRWTTAERKHWQELHRATGWVLPLDWIEGVWQTDDWTRPDGGDLLLLPGTSSIGLRLPLHRLPKEKLPRAITAEICEGAITLFLPPFLEAKAFVLLLDAIEKTAETLGSPPLSLEGYPPPYDETIESLSVIPDPGVIEVNLPPAADWESLETTVSALFLAAEKSGLRGTRTLPSGEISSTGGGGHLVLGGTSLETNPFLLKPTLLPSFLRFVQRHPVLSYLFSGRFIGPSSQAPRVDESFFEVPAALEIALRALEKMEAPADSGMVDAILRNLLLDLNGNTHRAEVSVDKFFNPFMPNGRLGLVEFRAIEMSPDAPTFLAIHALWRALAASFATRPYTEPLIDWKGKLHDDFLLPSVLEQDLGKVLDYLAADGFSFDPCWFQPQLAFRFPILAEETTGSAVWHLRRAVEPWPLLGEQPTPSGGLVRCVDSSTERLELRILPSGKIAQKATPPLSFTINGWELPLAPHPAGGVVGAVRFRTIHLPTCLHPQVLPQTPLLIQAFDPSGTELGAWFYHPLPVLTEGVAHHLLAAGETEALQLRKTRKMPPSQGESKTLDLLALG